MTETAYNAMSRHTLREGEGATRGESAVVLGDAFQQVAQGLARLQEALQLQGQESERKLQEAIQCQEQEAERRLLEALRLQEQRAATALREAVGRMEAKLQEKDDAIRALEQRLEETLQRVAVVKGRAECLKVPAGEGALRRLQETQEGEAVVEGKTEGLMRFAEEGELMRLEIRMQEVEASLQRAIQKFFPRVDALLRQLQETPPVKDSSFPPPPSPSSGETCGESSCRGMPAGGREDNSPIMTSPASTSTSRASSTSSCIIGSLFSKTMSKEATGDRRGGPGAGQGSGAVDERLQRKSMERRIQDVKEKVMAARKAPFRQSEVLLSAIRNGRLGEIQSLLDAGADINYVNEDGFIPLLVAVQAGQPDVVALLLQRGADANAVNVDGASAMHFAAADDRSGRCVDLLIAAGGDVNARNWSGATPLHWAADRRNEAAVRKLLLAGARRDLRAWKGLYKHKMPLHCTESTVIGDLLRS